MELTFAQVEAEVRRLVAENPDHIYRGKLRPYQPQKCYYVAPEDGSAEACLFGQALTNLGVPDDYLADFEFGPVQDILGSLGVECSDQEEWWMNEVQGAQDRKQDWAGALTYGDEEHPLHETDSV